jgi:hypothetical protein
VKYLDDRFPDASKPSNHGYYVALDWNGGPQCPASWRFCGVTGTAYPVLTAEQGKPLVALGSEVPTAVVCCYCSANFEL